MGTTGTEAAMPNSNNMARSRFMMTFEYEAERVFKTSGSARLTSINATRCAWD
jgi:hypothetical protein